jgi:hypothetical protein
LLASIPRVRNASCGGKSGQWKSRDLRAQKPSKW